MTTLLTQSELDALASVAIKTAASIDFGRTPTPCDIGHVLQRERIALLAERCCQNLPGDLIEIGSYAGATSSLLAGIARKYSRKLVCVDNFLNRDGFDLQAIKPVFVETMQPFADVLVWLELDAHRAETIARIQERRYCFAFSDNGHSYHDHETETVTLLAATDGLVAADDMYLAFSRKGVLDVVARTPGWQVIEHPSLAELYCIKTGSGE